MRRKNGVDRVAKHGGRVRGRRHQRARSAKPGAPVRSGSNVGCAILKLSVRNARPCVALPRLTPVLTMHDRSAPRAPLRL